MATINDRLCVILDANVMVAGTFLREHMGWSSEALEKIRLRTWADFAE